MGYKMELAFHPNAEANFNSQADALVAELAPRPQAAARSSFDPERFVSHTVQASGIIGPPCLGTVDASGREIGRSFVHGHEMVGLSDDSYVRLARLIDAMHRAPAIEKAVSPSVLLGLVFQWMEHRFKGESLPTMTAYVLADLNPRLRDTEVWTPVAHLRIQSAFRLGQVKFQPVARELLDRW